MPLAILQEYDIKKVRNVNSKFLTRLSYRYLYFIRHDHLKQEREKSRKLVNLQRTPGTTVYGL